MTNDQIGEEVRKVMDSRTAGLNELDACRKSIEVLQDLLDTYEMRVGELCR